MMFKDDLEYVNACIATGEVNTNLVSDGHHTFGELYEHRVMLFIKLCELTDLSSWKSKAHSDGSVWKDWFILGIFREKGKQITYHLPIAKWDECSFAETLDKAPEWDGHTSADVLKRLRNL